VSHDGLQDFHKENSSYFTGFKVLNETERTTTLYTLVEQANEDQLQFLMTVIQKKIQPQEEPKVVAREHVLIISINIPLLSCIVSSTPRQSGEV
jgi:hypothetical protein